MKIITEEYLREQFKGITDYPLEIEINEEDKLTPSAMDFLSMRHIKVKKVKNKIAGIEKYSKPIDKENWETPKSYIIYYTNEVVTKKPEGMTHLYGNTLVYKDDPRIKLRGQFDILLSKILDIQYSIAEKEPNHIIINELSEIMHYIMALSGAEMLNKPFELTSVLGLTHDDIRRISHNPVKFFGLKQMIMVDYTHGLIPVKLNMLRAEIRAVELVAVSVYKKDNMIERQDIITALNRLSSVFHILMYREIAGGFKNKSISLGRNL